MVPFLDNLLQNSIVLGSFRKKLHEGPLGVRGLGAEFRLRDVRLQEESLSLFGLQQQDDGWKSQQLFLIVLELGGPISRQQHRWHVARTSSLVCRCYFLIKSLHDGETEIMASCLSYHKRHECHGEASPLWSGHLPKTILANIIMLCVGDST